MIAAQARRRPLGLRATVVSVAVAVAVVLGLSMLRTMDPRSAADDARRLDTRVTAYLADLDRLGREGGQVVVEGMRPGLSDIAQHRLPDDVLMRMADGWVASMGSVHADVRALEVPAGLGPAAIRIERALVLYVRLAETLRRAAGAQGDERVALVDEAAVLGREADRQYDRALATLAEGRT